MKKILLFLQKLGRRSFALLTVLTLLSLTPLLPNQASRAATVPEINFSLQAVTNDFLISIGPVQSVDLTVTYDTQEGITDGFQAQGNSDPSNNDYYSASFFAGTVSGTNETPYTVLSGNFDLSALLLDGSTYEFNSDFTVSGETILFATPPFPTEAPDHVWVDDSWASANPGDHVGSGNWLYGYEAFDTIQEGVNAVKTGGTVTVFNGTYQEQVIIDNKNLTVEGESRDGVVIVSPTNLQRCFTDHLYERGYHHYAIVCVKNNANVTLTGFTVDGQYRGTANYRYVGIGYFNAGGTINNTLLKRVAEAETAFVHTGIFEETGSPIYSVTDDNGKRTLTVSNNVVQQYQKMGIHIIGPGMTTHIFNNTVIGNGLITTLSQYGIAADYGTGGSIHHNTVSNMRTNKPSDAFQHQGGTGIISFNGVDGVEIYENNVTNTDVGIAAAFYKQNVRIHHNTVTGSHWGYWLQSAPHAVQQFAYNEMVNNDYDLAMWAVLADLDATEYNDWSDKTDFDVIESLILHDCANTPFFGGECNSDDYTNRTWGSVKYAEPLVPVASCIAPQEGDEREARFTYSNPNWYDVILTGDWNQLLYGESSETAPFTAFAGLASNASAFSTNFMVGETVTWNLTGNEAVATSETPECLEEQEPTPTPTPSPSPAPVSNGSGGGNDGGSNGGPVSAPVCTATTPTAAPNVRIVSRTAQGITLAWDAVSGANDYAIEYTQQGGGTYGVTSTGGQTTFLVGALSPSANYTFQVWAKNDCASGPRGSVSTSTAPSILGAFTSFLSNDGDVLGETTENQVETVEIPGETDGVIQEDDGEVQAAGDILGSHEGQCVDRLPWWVIVGATAIVLAVVQRVLAGGKRLGMTLFTGLLGAAACYIFLCDPWKWMALIAATVVGLIVWRQLQKREDEKEAPRKGSSTFKRN